MTNELIAVVEAAIALMAGRSNGSGPEERDLLLALDQLPPDWKEHVGWAEVTSICDDRKLMIQAKHVLSIEQLSYPEGKRADVHEDRTNCHIVGLGPRYFHVMETYEDVKRRLAL